MTPITLEVFKAVTRGVENLRKVRVIDTADGSMARRKRRTFAIGRGFTMKENMSRRDLFKFGGIAAMAAAGAATLSGCGAKSSADFNADAAKAYAAETSQEKNIQAGHLRNGLPSFLQTPDPITDIKETYDYDVVVVGAGSAGVPCALSAWENGAKVALIQKENKASAHGNTGSAPDIANSDPADVANLISLLMVDSQHRPNRKLYEMWAQNGAEALRWTIDRAAKGGAQVIDQGNQQHAPLIKAHNYNINFVTCYFGPKPYCTGDGMQAMAKQAADEGVDVYYNTPGKQLVQDSDGRVTGIIALLPNGGYAQFNAKNGVVLATGDYQNDTDMLEYYLPDMTNFTPKQLGRTGDGHKMVVWAGGCIEPVGHTHMLHDFDAGPASMCDMPFLSVKNTTGKRFFCENAGMSLVNNYTRSAEDHGNDCQIFDSAYMTKAASFPGKLVDPEALKAYMPEESGEKKGVFPDQVRTFKADTLEELAEKLEIQDVDAFVAQVADWNAMCAAGKDTEYGLPAAYLQTVDTPPYYGIHRWVRMSSICCGVSVNDDLQCVRPDGSAIDGLYAIGNTAGNFYGGIDYPLTVPGLNLGHNYTQGYVLGRALANK